MNFCKDCKHHRAFLYNNETMSFRDDCTVLKEREHPVLGGKIDSIECGLMRIGPICGWDGKLWEPRK